MSPMRTATGAGRSGSVLIVIASILLVMIVLIFGLMEFVSSRRGQARRLHDDALMRMALDSGKAHSQAVLEDSYTTQSYTAAGQTWESVFAGVDPTTDALNLWRIEPGWARTSSFDAFDSGYCSHDGRGRWFTVGHFDRNLEACTDAEASFELRYAVGIVDLGGLFLANKARYAHLTPTSPSAPPTIDDGQLRRWNRTVPAVPAQGTPDAVTDIAEGVASSTLGYDQIRVNTWRSLPYDHSFTAFALLELGLGLDDSRSRLFTDSYQLVGSNALDSSAKYPLPPDPKSSRKVYYERTGGNVPDVYRAKGYAQVDLKFRQFSRRFSDFLPFEQNPNRVSTLDEAKWFNSQISSTALTQHGVSMRNRHPLALQHRAAYGFRTGIESTGTIDQPANWIAAWDSDLYKYPPWPWPIPNTPDMGLETPQRAEYDMWMQLDYVNSAGVQQGLRLNRVVADSAGLAIRAQPDAAQGRTMLWTPFGSPIGWFDAFTAITPPVSVTEVAGVGSDEDRRKNLYEMRYHWVLNLNTAPRKVLDGLVRLVCPTLAGVSDESDETAYQGAVDDIVDRIIAGRPYTAPTLPIGTADAWGASPVEDRQLRGLIRGGDSGIGPTAEFKIVGQNLWDLNGSPLANGTITVAGKHMARFWRDASSITSLGPDAKFHVALSRDPSNVDRRPPYIEPRPTASAGTGGTASSHPVAVVSARIVGNDTELTLRTQRSTSVAGTVLSTSDSEVEVLDTTQFPPTGGKIRINNEVMDYTSKTLTKLTGLIRPTPSAISHPLGSSVIRIHTTTINTAKGLPASSRGPLIVNAGTNSFPQSGVIRIGSELVAYADRDDTTFYSLTRGVGGTSATSHPNSTQIESLGSPVLGDLEYALLYKFDSPPLEPTYRQFAAGTSFTDAVVDYPGMTLAVGRSRHFRVVVRAELVDRDVAEATRSLSHDFVLRIDADGSVFRTLPAQTPRGSADLSTSTNRTWDSDILYADDENPPQYKGSGPAQSW